MMGVCLVAQSCPTLCHSMDCIPPGSSVHRLLQTKYQSGLSFPSPGDLPDPGIKPWSPALQADALSSEPPGSPIILYSYNQMRPNTLGELKDSKIMYHNIKYVLCRGNNIIRI